MKKSMWVVVAVAFIVFLYWCVYESPAAHQREREAKMQETHYLSLVRCSNCSGNPGLHATTMWIPFGEKVADQTCPNCKQVVGERKR